MVTSFLLRRGCKGVAIKANKVSLGNWSVAGVQSTDFSRVVQREKEFIESARHCPIGIETGRTALQIESDRRL